MKHVPPNAWGDRNEIHPPQIIDKMKRKVDWVWLSILIVWTIINIVTIIWALQKINESITCEGVYLEFDIVQQYDVILYYEENVNQRYFLLYRRSFKYHETYKWSCKIYGNSMVDCYSKR